MKSLADDMASAGKRLDDEEVTSYILSGLDIEYNPVVSAVAARTEPITLGELFTQLSSFEQRYALLSGHGSGSSANLASRGGRGTGNNRGRGRGGRGCGRGSGGRGSDSSERTVCQLCRKEGHTVLCCYKRFDASYQGPSDAKSASAATTSSYGIDTNWYSDSGSTDHITGDLEKLSVRDKYHGGDQVHTANDSGMEIDQIGRSLVRTPSKNLVLNNVLYVPQASKNLVSVHKLARDNDAFFEFHPSYFLIKDHTTKKVLLKGRCEGGLYPLKPFYNKQAHGVTKLPASRWHSRLGHPSTVVVRQVLNKNKVPFVLELNNDSVCDACQKGKSHQLPYPKSTSVSSAPLELVFSDVWGPASTSVGKNNFYVSFIDDYSKFTWIYLLRHKSEVFQRFHDFQNLVERMFDRKIVAMQTDWGRGIPKTKFFFPAHWHLASCVLSICASTEWLC